MEDGMAQVAILNPRHEDWPAIRSLGEGWWPARVSRPVLRIKSPLHHFNACRPNASDISFAPRG